MKKFFQFIVCFAKKFEENELFYFANALTYKIVLALFPFIIFFMTLLGFFNIELDIANYIFEMPKEISQIFVVFCEEVIYTQNFSLLSISLGIAIFNASTGFHYLIKGINKAFDIEEEGFIRSRVLSFFLVFVFAFLIIASFIFLIFCDAIEEMLIEYTNLTDISNKIFSMSSYILNALILFSCILIIFKLSIFKKISFKHLIPGAIIVSAGWLLMSKLFNIYINNFSKISVVYGSLGSIFILFVWLNLLSILILAGSQFNAMLIQRKKKKM